MTGTAKLTRAMANWEYGIGRSSVSEMRVEPRSHTHNEVIAKAATLEKNVIVTDKFMSPPNMAVQKFDPTPPT